MRLLKKNVLITGAGGQLGTRFAQAFATEGANLWLTDQSQERLTAAASKLPATQLLGSLPMDVTNPASVERVFAQVRAYGALDVLVNNAGIGVFTPFWERDYAEFMQVMSVNAGGTFLCTREALRIMKDQGQGAIVNIGSLYGVVSSDPRIYTDCERMNSEVYSASKAAVIQLTKYFAVHAADLGVRVNCVSPGGVFNHQGEDFVSNYSQRTPFKRMAKDGDICGAVIFLASDEAGYISGQNIVVDGGFTAW
ncbi:MAG: short-chain dehydrogenase [Betaproteobacteria bacterium HGW-Betaproteobacteria-3]|jgi:NAD(P)-dependent dehydrogenase (short-subunit alcohol dehydrogenase family)|nr:MAG: short-chain dehydrogenase [Betaproteobacteria bacterium HGW-Betaproteobacteria-3]